MADGTETETSSGASTFECQNGVKIIFLVLSATTVQAANKPMMSWLWYYMQKLHELEIKRLPVFQTTTHSVNPDSGFQSAPETAQDRK